MSLEQAALEYIDWARQPCGCAPSCPPLGLEGLLSPCPELAERAAALAAAHAAKLGLLAPPLGDPRPIAAATLRIAGAMCMREIPQLAQIILEHCPLPKGWWDLLLRDALLTPLCGQEGLEPPLRDQMLGLSPLTALFDRPPEGMESDCQALVRQLMKHPDGWRLLVRSLSQPVEPCRGSEGIAVLQWRADIMDRLRQNETGRALVLEIYEASCVQHARELRSQLQFARERLAALKPLRAELVWALAFAQWWKPLHGIQRAHELQVRKRLELPVHLLLDAMYVYGVAHHRTGGKI